PIVPADPDMGLLTAPPPPAEPVPELPIGWVIAAPVPLVPRPVILGIMPAVPAVPVAPAVPDPGAPLPPPVIPGVIGFPGLLVPQAAPTSAKIMLKRRAFHRPNIHILQPTWS